MEPVKKLINQKIFHESNTKIDLALLDEIINNTTKNNQIKVESEFIENQQDNQIKSEMMNLKINMTRSEELGREVFKKIMIKVSNEFINLNEVTNVNIDLYLNYLKSQLDIMCPDSIYNLGIYLLSDQCHIDINNMHYKNTDLEFTFNLKLLNREKELYIFKNLVKIIPNSENDTLIDHGYNRGNNKLFKLIVEKYKFKIITSELEGSKVQVNNLNNTPEFHKVTEIERFDRLRKLMEMGLSFNHQIDIHALDEYMKKMFNRQDEISISDLKRGYPLRNRYEDVDDDRKHFESVMRGDYKSTCFC